MPCSALISRETLLGGLNSYLYSYGESMGVMKWWNVRNMCKVLPAVGDA
jgi:hypothetical protein